MEHFAASPRTSSQLEETLMRSSDWCRLASSMLRMEMFAQEIGRKVDQPCRLLTILKRQKLTGKRSTLRNDNDLNKFMIKLFY
jgi:hypothetical protein